jgi:hypothetical protein
MRGPLPGVLAPPGKYTVKLTVDGKDYSQELTVLKDPNSKGTLEGIQEMVRLWRMVNADVHTTVNTVNQLEWIGKQVEDMIKLAGEIKGGDQVLPDILELQKTYMTLEDKLVTRKLMASDNKSYPDDLVIYGKLRYLSNMVGQGGGDVRNSEDFGPTNQQLEVYDLLNKRLQAAQAEYDDLLKNKIPAFNKKLADKNFMNIITGQKQQQGGMGAAMGGDDSDN